MSLHRPAVRPARPQFQFRGDTSVLRGRISFPEGLTIDVPGASPLPVDGGRTAATVAAHRFGGVLAFDSAVTRAAGNVIARGPETRARTVVAAEVRNLVAGDGKRGPVLTIGRLKAALDAVCAIHSDEPSISPLPGNLAFQRIAIDGYEIEASTSIDPFIAFDTWAAFSRATNVESSWLARDSRMPEEERSAALRISKSGHSIVTTIVRELRWRGKPYPAARIDGHSIAIPNFGRVTFGELLVGRFWRELTMVRFQLGSPWAYAGIACGVQAGGSWFGATDAVEMAEEPRTSRTRARAAPPAPPRPHFVSAPVYFVTDRARAGAGRTDYGTGRSPAGRLNYGIAEVTIPRSHRKTRLERPWKLWKLEFPESPARHFTVRTIIDMAKREFFNRLSRQVALSESGSAFVFVHGYNNAFVDALRQTGQLAFDLLFDGPAIAYSWPSMASPLRYSADRESAEWTVPHLVEFLGALHKWSGARSIHLIAHSMGNQALTGALQSLCGNRPTGPQLFSQVVLAAPDIDTAIFSEQIAPAIKQAGERTTLYASSRDRALWASRRLNAHPRAGDSAAGIVVVDKIDSIDASNVSTALGLGHSAHGRVRTVLEDLSNLIRNGLAPEKRQLVRQGRAPKIWWAFPA